jgi:hypothetical protein
LPGIKSPSSASNSSDFILIRILNKDYKILFSKNGNRVEKFSEAIKVSYFYSIDNNDNDKRDVCEKTMNNSSEKNGIYNNTNKNSDIEIKKNNNNNNDKNERLAVKRPILKSKTKSFARIPVQSQEFENVRLY